MKKALLLLFSASLSIPTFSQDDPFVVPDSSEHVLGGDHQASGHVGVLADVGFELEADNRGLKVIRSVVLDFMVGDYHAGRTTELVARLTKKGDFHDENARQLSEPVRNGVAILARLSFRHKNVPGDTQPTYFWSIQEKRIIQEHITQERVPVPGFVRDLASYYLRNRQRATVGVAIQPVSYVFHLLSPDDQAQARKMLGAMNEAALPSRIEASLLPCSIVIDRSDLIAALKDQRLTPAELLATENMTNTAGRLGCNFALEVSVVFIETDKESVQFSFTLRPIEAGTAQVYSSYIEMASRSSWGGPFR